MLKVAVNSFLAMNENDNGGYDKMLQHAVHVIITGHQNSINIHIHYIHQKICQILDENGLKQKRHNHDTR